MEVIYCNLIIFFKINTKFFLNIILFKKNRAQNILRKKIFSLFLNQNVIT